MSIDKEIRREAYVAPSIEVIRMENEGVIAASNDRYNPRPLYKSYKASSPAYNSASESDLGDLINDILTIEN